MSFVKLLDEIKGITCFLESQKKLVDKAGLERLMKGHVNNIKPRVGLTCSPAEAESFIGMVSSGPWTDAQKEELSEWINSRLLASTSPDGPTQRRRPGQKIDTFCNYFSEKDVSILSDTSTTLACKLDCSLDTFIALSFCFVVLRVTLCVCLFTHTRNAMYARHCHQNATRRIAPSI